jgi:hypothetical protein
MILEPNYEPDVEIGYSVGGYDYRYRRQIPDFVPAAGQARSRLHGVAKSLAFINAEQALAAWPVGRDVAISYDTGNPGRAVLAGTQPTMQSPHRFGRIVLPPIAIAGVLAWGLWALRIY